MTTQTTGMFYTAPQVAQILGVGKDTVRRMRRTGHLTNYRPTRPGAEKVHALFHPEEVVRIKQAMERGELRVFRRKPRVKDVLTVTEVIRFIESKADMRDVVTIMEVLSSRLETISNGHAPAYNGGNWSNPLKQASLLED